MTAPSFATEKALERRRRRNVRRRARNSNASGKQLYPHRPDGRKFPHRAVGQITDAAQRLEDCGAHVPDKSSAAGRIILVSQYQNAWRRNLKNTVPEIATVMERAAHHGRLTAAQSSR